MTHRDPVDYLTEEIDEMLGAGRVGLYEFPQFLRGAFSDLTRDEERRIAREVLRRLLDDGRAKLVWARWSGQKYGDDATGVDPPQESWDRLTDDPYLAVEPT